MKKLRIYKKRVGVTFTKPYFECMDYLVDQGIYLDYQDAVRDAVRILLGSYGLSPFWPDGRKKPELSE